MFGLDDGTTVPADGEDECFWGCVLQQF
jgi:hypothetical protein